MHKTRVEHPKVLLVGQKYMTAAIEHKHYARLEGLTRDTFLNYGRKSFITLGLGLNYECKMFYSSGSRPCKKFFFFDDEAFIFSFCLLQTSL
jgi:hypothetical protein